MIRHLRRFGHQALPWFAMTLCWILATSAALADESYSGFDLDALAKASAEQKLFDTTYERGEAAARFDAYLRDTMSADRETFTRATHQWWSRFRADTSGRLEARYHIAFGNYMQDVTFGDTRDQTEDVREGMTLDAYAKLVVAVSRTPNADIEALATAHGLDDKEHFDRVNAAWIRAMREDETHALMQQYGRLYQQHAGADYAAERQEKLANLLADRNREPVAEDRQPPKPPTAEDYAEQLTSVVARERWYAARQLAFQCKRYQDFGDRVGADLKRHCSRDAIERHVLPVIAELLREFDDRHLTLASGVLGLVLDLDMGDALGRSAAEDALVRAEARLTALHAEFEPIRHKAVPQKATLRNTIDAYRVSIGELERHLADW